MSLDSLGISDEANTKNSNSIMTYRPLQEHSNYVVHYISSTFVKIEQLKTDLNAEYQQEKHALTELNEQLRLMIDRVEQLESQNSTYVAKLTDLRRQGFIVATTGKQNDEHYRLQSHIMAVNYEKVSYESEIEFFQLQIKIYQQMIQAENQSIDEQRLKLEQELNQSASALVNLRTSYEELGNKVGSYRTTSKLESELNTIQTQYEEQFTAQASDLDYLQESILAMVILQYTVPDGLRLQPGSELKIYSESGAAVAQKLSNQSAFSSSLHQELVLKDISSMGM
ncbi:unnamed protein product [Rotaria sp. Silwood1]|nr:unnamed protein product [Rotaria sp. Silwood1]